MTGQHRADRDPAPVEPPSTARPVLVPLSETPLAAPGDVELFDGPGGLGPDGEPTLLLQPVRLRASGGHRQRRSRRRPAVVVGAIAAMAALGTGAALLERSLSGGDGRQVAIPLPTAAAPSTLAGTASASPAASAAGRATGAAPARSASARAGAGARASAAPATTAAAAGAAPSPTPSASGPRTLQLGDTGPDVVDLQTRLREIHLEHRKPTGSYDTVTQNDVARFQSQYGITGDPSGVYGPATRAKLLSLTGG